MEPKKEEKAKKEIETAFDLCAICKKQGTDECGRCEVPHDLINLFQPDKSKVIVNPKVKLYARWVNCIGKECPESKDGKCNREQLADFPKDGKCLFPVYIVYDKEDEDCGAFESSAISHEITDVPF